MLTGPFDSGCSGKRVEPSLIMQRNSLRSSEFLCNLVKAATFRLGQANPGEGEGRQSRSHEEQVNTCAADFLCGQQRHVSGSLKDLCSLESGRRHNRTLKCNQNARLENKPTSNGGKSSARANFPPQLSMLVKAMAIGLPGWSNSSAAMNQEIGPGPSS